MTGNKLMKVFQFKTFLLSLILIVLFLSSKLNCDLNGMEGENLNLTVTWTDETFIQAKIDKLGPYNVEDNNHEVIYRLLCMVDNNNQKCYCTKHTELNIQTTCLSKSIIWTFTSLEIRNTGIHTIELSGSEKIMKNVTVRVFGPPDRPTNLKIDKTGESGKLRLSWTPGYDGGSIQTFRVSYEMFGKQLIEVTSNNYVDIDVTNLQSNSMIIISVSGENKFGRGASSKSIKYSIPNKGEYPERVLLIAPFTIAVVSMPLLIIVIILLWLQMKGKVSLQCCKPHSQSTNNPIKSNNYKENTMTILSDIYIIGSSSHDDFAPSRNSNVDYSDDYDYVHPYSHHNVYDKEEEDCDA